MMIEMEGGEEAIRFVRTVLDRLTVISCTELVIPQTCSISFPAACIRVLFDTLRVCLSLWTSMNFRGHFLRLFCVEFTKFRFNLEMVDWGLHCTAEVDF